LFFTAVHLPLSIVDDQKVEVDYSISPADIVLSDGYLWVDASVRLRRRAESDPGDERPADFRAKLLRVARPYRDNDLIAELKSMGLRPATPTELYFYGKSHRARPGDVILAFGSLLNTYYIRVVESGMLAGTTDRHGTWPTCSLVLAVGR
jgi:hypothetical protein